MKSTLPDDRRRGVKAASLVAAVLAFAQLPPAFAAGTPEYLKRPDPSFRWELKSPGGIEMNSQEWRGTLWKHSLRLFQPPQVKNPSHALLVLRGSESAFGPEEWENLTETATRAGIVAAVLDQVPNGTALARYRGEDEYIAHTFRQFLATGDESWPLLLPMVKSVQRAMDCLQAVSKEKLGQKIEKFIILGNGPRGWCAWLAGALDPRVSGIVPSGFTGVNFPKIVSLELASRGNAWKRFSGISTRGLDLPTSSLADILEGSLCDRLVQLVDPYTYRKELGMPKLLLKEENSLLPVDAIDAFIGDLGGETYVYYRRGHSSGGGPQDDFLIETLSAFCRKVASGQPGPRFSWAFREEKDSVIFELRPADPPKAVDLLISVAGDPLEGSFFPRWQALLLEKKGDVYQRTFTLPKKEKGQMAAYARLIYDGPEGKPFALCTPARVFGRKEPPKPVEMQPDPAPPGPRGDFDRVTEGLSKFRQIDFKKVTRIVISWLRVEPVILEKKGETWVVASRYGYPADERLVEEILRSLQDFEAEVAGESASSHEVFQVSEERGAALVFEGPGGEVLGKIVVGKAAGGALLSISAVFVRFGSDIVTYRIESAIQNAARLYWRGLQPGEYLERRLKICAPDEQVVKAVISREGQDPLTIERAPAPPAAAGRPFPLERFVASSGEKRSVVPDGRAFQARNLLSGWESERIRDAAKPGPPEDHGLDRPILKVALTIAKKDPAAPPAPGSPAGERTVAISFGSPAISKDGKETGRHIAIDAKEHAGRVYIVDQFQFKALADVTFQTLTEEKVAPAARPDVPPPAKGKARRSSAKTRGERP